MENITKKSPAFSGNMGVKTYRIYDSDYYPETGHLHGVLLFSGERHPYNIEGLFNRDKKTFDFVIKPSLLIGQEIKQPMFFSFTGDFGSGKTIEGKYGDNPNEVTECVLAIYKNFD